MSRVSPYLDHVAKWEVRSCITARECVAMVELGADSNTILIGPLTDLLQTSKLPTYKKGAEWQVRMKDVINQPHITWESWKAPEPMVSKKRMAELANVDPLSKVMTKDLELANPDTDYLADGVLDKAIEEDEAARLRLKDALTLFDGAENDSKKEIQRLQALYA